MIEDIITGMALLAEGALHDADNVMAFTLDNLGWLMLPGTVVAVVLGRFIHRFGRDQESGPTS